MKLKGILEWCKGTGKFKNKNLKEYRVTGYYFKDKYDFLIDKFNELNISVELEDFESKNGVEMDMLVVEAVAKKLNINEALVRWNSCTTWERYNER